MRPTHYACQAYVSGAVAQPFEATDNLRMDLAKALGAAIRAARKSAGLTQPQLAEKAQCQQGSISRVERGEQGVSIDALIRIAQGLGMAVSSLWLKAEGSDALPARPRQATKGSEVRNLEDESDQLATVVSELVRVLSAKLPAAAPDLVKSLARERDKAQAQGQNAQVLELAAHAAEKALKPSGSVTPSAAPPGSSAQRPRR